MRFAYLRLDAAYVKRGAEGHVASVALASATAAADDGYRRVVGFDVVDAESYPSWLGFLRSLKERGVDGVACAASDAHAGLRRAIGEVLAGAAWQRCVVHLEHSVCACAKIKRARSPMGRVIASVFREENPRLVRGLCSQATDEIGAACKSAGELLEEAETDALACLAFPKEHGRRLRADNVQKRVNREIKRRSRVVQVFPSTASLVRLVGAVLAEQDIAEYDLLAIMGRFFDAMVVPVGRMPREARLEAAISGSFLRDMQSRVGGPIEALPGVFDGGPAVYVNEESKLPWTECLPNRAVYVDGIQEPVEIMFGDMLCVGFDVETGELRDISAEKCRKVRERFGTKDSIESADREIMKIVERNRGECAG